MADCVKDTCPTAQNDGAHGVPEQVEPRSPDGKGPGSTMMALVFSGKRRIELAHVPVPQIMHPTDAIVKVKLAGICGSDLHPFHEREKGLARGCVTGHEMTGTVVAVGSAVTDLKVGDHVMSPFTTCCGDCFFCASGATCRCCHAQARLFGWVTEDELCLRPESRLGIQGTQAEYARVPLADGTLMKVPDGVSDEEAILLGDILSTGFFCAEQGVKAGDSVVVVGCGPVGLLTVLAAQHLGAARVWAVDGIPARLAMAGSLGATALDYTARDVPAVIREATNGRGADASLEVVGAPSALRLAFDALRPGGVLASVGVHTNPSFPWTPVEAYDKNLTLKMGRCPARAYMAKLARLVAESTDRPWLRIITHRLPLSDGVRGYQLFDEKLDGCIKVVLMADDSGEKPLAAE